MIVRYFYDEALDRVTYLLGSSRAGTAFIIDPARHIMPYIQSATAHYLRITGIIETHLHDDHISGTRELAAVTDATIYLSAQEDYDYPGENVTLLNAESIIEVGELRLTVLPMPGHTPGHVALRLHHTDDAHPVGIFSGDSLLQPDAETVKRYQAMPDDLQIWHGLRAALPTCTIGYEKRHNPYFQAANTPLTATRPAYHDYIRSVNRTGAMLLRDLAPIPKSDGQALLAALTGIAANVIDTRPDPDYAVQYIEGTLNIPASYREFARWAALYVDYDRPTYLISEEGALPRILSELHAVGIDDIAGYFTPEIVSEFDASLPYIAVTDAAKQHKNGEARILDVRTPEERQRSHIPGALFMDMADVPEHLEQLPKDKLLIVHCEMGVRAQIVASYLKDRGFKVANMTGGIEAWQAAALPLEGNLESSDET